MDAEPRIFTKPLQRLDRPWARPGFEVHPDLPGKLIRKEGVAESAEDAVIACAIVRQELQTLESDYGVHNSGFDAVIGPGEGKWNIQYTLTGIIENAAPVDTLLDLHEASPLDAETASEIDAALTGMLAYFKDRATEGGFFPLDMLYLGQFVYAHDRQPGGRCILVDVEPFRTSYITPPRQGAKVVEVAELANSVGLLADGVARLHKRAPEQALASKEALPEVLAAIPDITSEVRDLKAQALRAVFEGELEAFENTLLYDDESSWILFHANAGMVNTERIWKEQKGGHD